MAADRPLQAMAQAFTLLTQEMGSGMSLAQFAHACSLVSVLFGCLGFAFKFAEKDYTAKVEDLAAAAKEVNTLKDIVEIDIEANRVRRGGSHTRNLLRVKRGIEMVKILFEHILESENSHLRDAAAIAYEQVFAKHHPWAIRKAVGAGTYALPSKSQFLKKLNEDENSARTQMTNFVASANPVIKYVENLFTSRNLGIDW